jgi:hypothetical protein
MTTAASNALKRSAISSIGFSGAGFLTCYHLGVADCLLRHGILAQDSDKHEDPILTGVSGGALCAAGVALGVSPEDGMNTVLHVAKSTNAQGRLDALTPGFSLIDQVEENFCDSLNKAIDGDVELLQRRLQNSRLRIGFTDRRVFPPFAHNTRAYFYIDEFRDVNDVVAACILSSYIPFVTGPAWGSLHTSNLAVKRAKERIHEMVELGFCKSGETGQVVKPSNSYDPFANREYFWDGGLTNVFPIVDEDTVIVTPICARFSPNPYISPVVEDDSIRTIRVDPRSEVFLSTANLETLRQMTISSDETVLQGRFSQGHDDARRFLEEKNFLSVYSSVASPSRTVNKPDLAAQS